MRSIDEIIAAFGPGGLEAHSEAENSDNPIYLLPLSKLYFAPLLNLLTSNLGLPRAADKEEFRRLLVTRLAQGHQLIRFIQR
jgi:hypothetical protein